MESAIKQYTLYSIVPYRGGYRARTRIEYADGNTQIKEFTGKSRMTVTQRMQDYLQPLHIDDVADGIVATGCRRMGN